MKPYTQPTIIGVYALLGLLGFLGGAIMAFLAYKNADIRFVWLAMACTSNGLVCSAVSALLDHTAKAAHWAEQTAILALRSPGNGRRVQGDGKITWERMGE